MRPGEIITDEDPIPLNPGRARIRITVVNRADRAVQVGSHYHFAAVNPSLEFDRAKAWGNRLDVPSGTAVRFEPGVAREVDLVDVGGARLVRGLRLEYAGELDTRDHEPTPFTYGEKGEGHHGEHIVH
ncbi:urease subunit beta [Saccharopolyspora antimicrobica]|uniref:Urease subunit beta n=2 Tax=Saccharopolyspora TaxID=1835 RepID=A0A1I5F6I9_9PSEU|nr:MULTISPECIES: urease subunit beta [Saccharopolyspora]RKT83702.1 urease subunit beta [Saccharopolyspora antimicrobica]SEG80926.1 urease subunit beta [Saccharopolyspora kobensis]SFD13712.1 urease subunit beta [Saccharopolyspora kobensis]SFO19280.1 urease subunit beta [Saccharopolyspora antimicrobica]